MNDRPLSLWLFNWAFAATSSTIVSGSVAERATVPAHCFGAMALIGVIYPVVVHWAWSADGWASPFKTSGDLLFGCGAIDFAGSTVVHAVGGTVALVGAVVVGPRLGRFIRLADGSSTVNRMPMQSPALHALGTLILWTGWFGFNGGTAATLDPTVVGIDNMVYVTSRAMLGTALAGAAGSIAVFVCLRVTDGKFDSMAGGNGILAGLVGITASAPLVSPLGAIIVGMVSGVVYVLSSRLLVHLRVDDVVEASPVHLFCGIVGTLMVGLFAEPNAVELAYGPQDESCCGLFYGCSGKLLAANTVFILSVIAWCVPLALVVFTCLRSLGILRVNRSVEKNGLDNVLVPKNDTVSDALKRALRRAGISATVGGLESIGSHNSRSISKSVTSSMHLG
jgi:Amt family ammonium transporter